MTTSPGAISRLRQLVAQVWDSSTQKTISSVLEECYRLSPETEADPGAYDLVNNPFWRKILDCCNDPEVRRLTILKSTQVGGTLTTQGILLGAAIVDPAPAMYVVPTRDELQVQRDRIYGNALVSADIMRDLVPARTSWNFNTMRLGASNVYLAYAKSPQRLRGKPCKRVILTERDVYSYRGAAGDPYKAAVERTKQFYESLIVDESTPVGEESPTAASYDASNQERYEVECPHCGHWQELRFFPYKTGKYAGGGGIAGYHDQAGNLLEPEEAERNAYYVCAAGCKIEPRYKNAMITSAYERGAGWAPEGTHYRNDPKTGKPVLEGKPRRSRRHSGFHIWALMSPKISVGRVAAEYVSAVQEGRLRDFWQNWLGLRYGVGKKTPKWETIAARFARPSFQRGQVDNKAWFLTGAADVQEDLVYWLVVGWGPFRTPYIVDWGEIHKHENDDAGIVLASDIKQLPSVLLDKAYPVNGVNPRGQASLKVRLNGVDSNYRVSDVHDFVRSVNDERRVRAIRGDDSVKGIDRRYRRAVIEANQRSGEKYEGGLVQWQIYKTYYQDNITEKLLADAQSTGAIHFPDDILPAGQKLVRQLCNVRKGSTGYYETRDRNLGKDYRDLLGYNEALADMVVDMSIEGRNKWSEENWVKAHRKETRQKEARQRNRENRRASDGL